MQKQELHLLSRAMSVIYQVAGPMIVFVTEGDLMAPTIIRVGDVAHLPQKAVLITEPDGYLVAAFLPDEARKVADIFEAMTHDKQLEDPRLRDPRLTNFITGLRRCAEYADAIGGRE